MVVSGKSISSVVLALLVGIGGIAAAEISGQAETIPVATAIPVIFTQTLDAAKAKPGEAVTVKTTQVVLLPGGETIPSGTPLIGHVIEATPFVFNPAPYAVQKPSVVSVHFDKIATSGSTIPVSFSVRAIAGPVASHEASILHYRDETDSTGTRILIGGSEFSPVESQVLSPRGDVVGYNRKNGVFARLIAEDYESKNSVLDCAATDSEQSVGIFSASACGVYGMDAASMSDSGVNGDGAFVLESNSETVKLYAKSEALLQVVGKGL
jgi:hypothetical protein